MQLKGQLQTRKWQDQSGQERYTTEVVLQRFRGELVLRGGRERAHLCPRIAMAATGAGPPASPPAARPRRRRQGVSENFDELDDAIPFQRLNRTVPRERVPAIRA